MHGDVFRCATIVCVLKSCVAGTAGACGGTRGSAAREACVCSAGPRCSWHVRYGKDSISRCMGMCVGMF